MAIALLVISSTSSFGASVKPHMVRGLRESIGRTGMNAATCASPSGVATSRRRYPTRVARALELGLETAMVATRT